MHEHRMSPEKYSKQSGKNALILFGGEKCCAASQLRPKHFPKCWFRKYLRTCVLWIPQWKNSGYRSISRGGTLNLGNTKDASPLWSWEGRSLVQVRIQVPFTQAIPMRLFVECQDACPMSRSLLVFTAFSYGTTVDVFC